MSNVLIVGASRGLGASLVNEYAANGKNSIYATSRSAKPPASTEQVKYIPGIDIAKETAGQELVSHMKSLGATLDIVIITAGYFRTETFEEPSWQEEVKMYTTSSIAPVFICHHLVKAGLMAKGSKIILVSSESGSITLRHESEGGGNYGHHASKSALNMVGKLLSLDLKEKGVAVGIVHVGSQRIYIILNGALIIEQPGFMRTEMTKTVGFDKFWNDGGGMEFFYSTTAGLDPNRRGRISCYT